VLHNPAYAAYSLCKLTVVTIMQAYFINQNYQLKKIGAIYNILVLDLRSKFSHMRYCIQHANLQNCSSQCHTLPIVAAILSRGLHQQPFSSAQPFLHVSIYFFTVFSDKIYSPNSCIFSTGKTSSSILNSYTEQGSPHTYLP
jgi:hypothetical protein